MPELALLAIFAVAAFLVAWMVNGIVGLLSGERPRDTGRLWVDALFGIFSILELGFVGRILNHLGINTLPRKFIIFVGLLCVLLFLMKACHRDRNDNLYTYTESSQHDRSKNNR
jgi:hypothetical protein